MLSLVPTSVLVSTSRRRAASASPPPSSRVTLESSAESSVDLQDNELDELQIQSDSPSPSRSPFLLLESPILHLQSLLLQSPLFPASLSLFLLLKSPFLLLQSLLAACLPTGGFPAVLVLVMLSSNVLILKFSGTLVLSPAPLKKCIRPPLSIRNMFVVRFRGRKHLLCGVSLLFLKMLLTPCLLVGLLSSLDSNLFLSSIDPLLTYSTSSCCVNVFVASYFVYCLLVGEVRHVGELGGLVPPP